MVKVVSSRVVGFGLAAVCSAFTLASCGGDSGGGDDRDEGGGGTSSTNGGAGPTGGTSGAMGGGTSGASTGGSATGGSSGASNGGASGLAGSATGGSGGTATACAPNPPVQTCSGSAVNMHAMPDGVVIDFARYTVASGAWGSMALGDLTGGTSLYPTNTAITRTIDNGQLRMQATLPPYSMAAGAPANYAGAVFWFGPCIDASMFDGVSLNVGGTLNGAVLQFQIQTYLDYPAEPHNSKGGCQFTDCATKWSECKGPELAVPVPATAEELNFPFAMFTGGSPEAGVTPEGLVGLQVEFECQAEVECVVDVTLGTISFTSG